MIIEFLPKHSLNFGEDFETILSFLYKKTTFYATKKQLSLYI